jgi:hypothetical protein
MPTSEVDDPPRTDLPVKVIGEDRHTCDFTKLLGPNLATVVMD